VGVGLGVAAQYLPPVFVNTPPQTIISPSLPVQTEVGQYRGSGALMRLVAVQLSVLGLYRPPELKAPMALFHPPQTIISVPVQIAVKRDRASGAPLVLVAIQLSVLGLYLPPVL
jgi:hypothetical protein